MMAPEQWERINSIFDMAVDLEPADQERCVREAAAGDEDLAEVVMSLLRARSLRVMLPNALQVALQPGIIGANSSIRDPSTRGETISDDVGSSRTVINESSPWFTEKIGSYALVERIGKGGMGVVYRAYDVARQRFVALKTLKKTGSANLDRFKREFRTFADLTHPNLVSLYELIADGERWCFTMELVQGKCFLEYISSIGPSDAETVEQPRLQRLRAAFQQLAGAVAALHAADKLHRDLKPSNVLVTPENRVVVLDFGLGVELDHSGMHESTMDQVIGSVPYMSPEQAGGKALSPASDWYSVGVMLYEALTGRLPFEGSVLDVLTAKREQEAGPPVAMNPRTPEDLNALCLELLRRDPFQRPHATEILQRFGARLEFASEVQSALRRENFFVGREPELQCLRDAYNAARRSAAVVYVTGHSGAGKTSLVHHFLAEIAGDPDAVVFRGRCLEQESLPFKALDSLVDCLIQYLRRLKPEQVTAVMPRDIRPLARVFPGIWQVSGVSASPVIGTPDPDPVEVRRRAAAAMGELLARIGDRHPLVLFIDDLQWGDRDSASFLIDVLTPPHTPNFLGIACYRCEDAAASSFLGALEEFRARTPLPFHERRVTVGELEPKDTRELVRRILGAYDERSTALVDDIARESAGRAFLVYELIEHFRSCSDKLPTGSLALDAVLWRRVDSLPQDTKGFLEIVAIAGRPIKELDAYRAAGLVTDNMVIPALKASRLIRSTPTGTHNGLEVHHDRVREVILDHLQTTTIEKHHRRLARVYSGSDQFDPELLAFHLSRGGLPEEAADNYAKAAAKASEALAFEHAALLYRQALNLKAWALDQQRTLRIQLGNALNNAGRGAEAAKEYLSATAHADPALALDLQHRASLALLTSGHVDEGLTCLEPVMKAIGTRLAQTPSHALLSLLARRLQLRLRGCRFLEQAESAVSATALQRIDIGWSVVIGLSMIDPIRGANFQTRSLLRALKAGEPFRVARALAIEAAHLASSGAIKRAKIVLADAERLALRLQRPYANGVVELARGAVAYFEERWRDSLQHCRAAAATFRLHCTGATGEIDTANVLSLWSLVRMGSVAELTRIGPSLLKEARDRGDLYAIANLNSLIMSLVRLADDDPDGARNDLKEVMALWSQNGYHVQHHNAMVTLVPLELYASDPKSAWDRVQAAGSKFRWSLLSHVHCLKIEMLQMRAYCALAMALQADEPTKYLSIASRDAQRLRREGLPWTAALHDYIMGTVAYLNGDSADARRRLAAAVSGFESVHANLHAAVTKRRLADLSTGEQAQALRESADKWLRSQGVVNPDRMVQAYAPGFPI
jgi:tetratricopeptide (TPR) repeat protein